MVDLYNGGRRTSSRGVPNARSIPLVAINHSLQQDERYTIACPGTLLQFKWNLIFAEFSLKCAQFLLPSHQWPQLFG
jgi:hypothetical protein